MAVQKIQKGFASQFDEGDSASEDQMLVKPNDVQKKAF